MRRETYTARRRGMETATWMRNRNTVRHTVRGLGSISLMALMGGIVLVVGLIYVTQGTRATAYDYELSNIEAEINELTAKREDLAVERARLTSIAASEQSAVAMAMTESNVSGYAD